MRLRAKFVDLQASDTPKCPNCPLEDADHKKKNQPRIRNNLKLPKIILGGSAQLP